MKTQSRPFTVTVKRQKRAKGKSIWSDTPNMADMLAQAETGDNPAGSASTASRAPQSTAASNASTQASKSQARADSGKTQERRILADLTPVELPIVEVEPEQSKRPRGRPRKVVDTSISAGISTTPEQAAADRAFRAALSDPAKRPTASVRSRSATLRPSASEISDARTFDEAGEQRVTSFGLADVDDTGVAQAPAGLGESTDGTASDVGRGSRRRTDVALRRGERWKRHLPRWKR